MVALGGAPLASPAALAPPAAAAGAAADLAAQVRDLAARLTAVEEAVASYGVEEEEEEEDEDEEMME